MAFIFRSAHLEFHYTGEVESSSGNTNHSKNSTEEKSTKFIEEDQLYKKFLNLKIRLLNQLTSILYI